MTATAPRETSLNPATCPYWCSLGCTQGCGLTPAVCDHHGCDACLDRRTCPRYVPPEPTRVDALLTRLRAQGP